MRAHACVYSTRLQYHYAICLFSADLGGLLGLYLGGSAISLFEIVDFFVYNLAIHLTVWRKRKLIQVQPTYCLASSNSCNSNSVVTSEVKASNQINHPAAQVF